MSGALWFLAGCITTSVSIFVGAYLQERRTRRPWLDAPDSEQFASGCQRFTEAQGI